MTSLTSAAVVSTTEFSTLELDIDLAQSLGESLFIEEASSVEEPPQPGRHLSTKTSNTEESILPKQEGLTHGQTEGVLSETRPIVPSNDIIIENNPVTGPPINGDAGNNTLNGSNVNDTLDGHDGNDTLNGHDGNDRLYGGKDNDLLRGHDDNDRLWGEGQNDKLKGNDMTL